MFDTMTFTKVLGSFCGALLIFLLGSWAAESLYHTGGKHGEDHAQGYVIDTGEGDGAEEVAEEGPSLPSFTPQPMSARASASTTNALPVISWRRVRTARAPICMVWSDVTWPRRRASAI